MTLDFWDTLILRASAAARASYIHPRARLSEPASIVIGEHVQVYAGATLSGRGDPKPALQLGRYVIVRENAYIDAHGGWIKLEAGVFVGQNAVIYGQGGVHIGENTLLAPGVTLIAATHHFASRDIPIKFQPETYMGIRIGSDCWLGANVVVLDGANIADGCVVGAGSVVTSDLPAFSVAVGVPARAKRSRGSEAGPSRVS